MGEKVIRTVQSSDRVTAPWGCKEIGRLASTERGKLVAVALTFWTTGNSADGFYFRQGNCHVSFLNGAPAGSRVAFPTGRMKAEHFLKLVKHFVFRVKSSNEGPVLFLIMENHDSHLSIAALDYCKEDGVTVVSFPPHCRHQLQLLTGISVGHQWPMSIVHVTHGSQTMAIHDALSIINRRLNFLAASADIKAGFLVTVIFP